MPERTDFCIIGGGPAGISAALMARNRGKSVVVVTLAPEDSGLYKAERIDNYPGLPSITGAQLHECMLEHAVSLGIAFVRGRVIGITKFNDRFFVAVGSEALECSAVILASGVTQKSAFSGERELLGRGVSYCATCDGMLYKGKRVAVIGLSSDAPHEADFLRDIGCEVEYFDDKSLKYEIRGTDRVTELIAGGSAYELDGVFIFRNSIALSSLLPGLELEDNHIKTDRVMMTSIEGVFAAGDCTGKPYQIAKAVGEGNVAALSAADWIDKKHSQTKE